MGLQRGVGLGDAGWALPDGDTGIGAGRESGAQEAGSAFNGNFSCEWRDVYGAADGRDPDSGRVNVLPCAEPWAGAGTLTAACRTTVLGSCFRGKGRVMSEKKNLWNHFVK